MSSEAKTEEELFADHIESPGSYRDKVKPTSQQNGDVVQAGRPIAFFKSIHSNNQNKMETQNIDNPVLGSRNHRVNLHAHNYRRHMMKNNDAKENYNHGGSGSVTVLLAITTVSFIFYYVFNAIF